MSGDEFGRQHASRVVGLAGITTLIMNLKSRPGTI